MTASICGTKPGSEVPEAHPVAIFPLGWGTAAGPVERVSASRELSDQDVEVEAHLSSCEVGGTFQGARH